MLFVGIIDVHHRPVAQRRRRQLKHQQQQPEELRDHPGGLLLPPPRPRAEPRRRHAAQRHEGRGARQHAPHSRLPPALPRDGPAAVPPQRVEFPVREFDGATSSTSGGSPSSSGAPCAWCSPTRPTPRRCTSASASSRWWWRRGRGRCCPPAGGRNAADIEHTAQRAVRYVTDGRSIYSHIR